GYYEFYTRARDTATNYESAPGSRDALCGYDNVAPASSVNVISPYWQTSIPLTITASASDGASGVKDVTLWYRYSADNITFGAWASFGTDSVSPWSWSFSAPSGDGYYEFYSIASDNAGLSESAPAGRDSLCGVDTNAPYIISTTPADGATGVSVTQNIIIQFSEKMNTSSVQYTCFPDPGGWVESWNPAKDTLTLNHNIFTGEVTYTFNVTIAKDPAGNAIATDRSFYAATSIAIGTVNNIANIQGSPDDLYADFTMGGNTETVSVAGSGYPTGIGVIVKVEIAAEYHVTGTVTDDQLRMKQNLGTFTNHDWLPSSTIDVTQYFDVTSEKPSWSWADISSMQVTLTNVKVGGGDTYIVYVDTVFVRVNYYNRWNFTAASGASATATGPTGYANTYPVTIVYSYSGTPDNVSLYYTIDGGTNWNFIGDDTTVDGSYGWTIPADGEYGWYAVANGGGSVETAPVSGTTPEASPYIVDTQLPTSSVAQISPYWKSSTPFAITATASDSLSGVKNVTLYYRHSSDNSSWGDWTSFGTDTVSPWSWSFTAPSSDGYYEFYSIAVDNSNNIEVAPASRDSLCGVDSNPPSSSVNTLSLYWQTASPLTITATASDTLSGLASVELWHRYSTDNVSWGGWSLFGTDTVSPWSWSFGFSNGTGYYEFYSRARDNATNYESAPASRDTLCGYDNAVPTSNVNVISPYWQTTSPITITATASDTVSGLASVELWYRYAVDNLTWGGWVLSGTDTASPWSWSFNFPNGTGYYEFYSRARDNATNYESAPASRDTLCGYDNAAPASSVNVISPYWQTTSPLTITGTASDTGYSGLASVELWYRYSTDNTSWGGWGLFGTDSVSPWQWSFSFSNGTGYYEFYSRSRDNATNYESAPGSRDALCGYDNAAPTSSVNVISPYWQTSTPFTVSASASDTMSGVKNVSLYYRFSSDNVTFGGWTSFGTDTVSPWSWSFTAPSGDGYYEFYSIASDNAGLIESAPGSADTICVVDTNAPYIISTTPADSATGVSVTQNIIIQFSEKMNTSSVEYTSFPDPGNWVGSWNATNDTLTLTHNDFTPEVTYTFNVTIAKDVAGHALVSGPVLNPWSFTIMTTTLPSAPTNVMAEKSGNDIILSWDPMYGADFYRVYRSPNVNGTGFSWTPVNETTSTSCIRPNELADSNNYSYVIRSVSNTAGENLTCSDMAFKLCFNFVAPVGLLHDNVFSLPYNTELTTASGLKSDIGANCSKVSKWNPVTQVWISYPFNNFPIEPGAGYKAVVTADTVYKIVGAHNSSVE
ncbi:MAG: Ig-like domain-containing protein, partial [Thermoplasmatales archaeon]|nr:Ig-like domain-containing protein [Thermoplasmatales archaeon]